MGLGRGGQIIAFDYSPSDTTINLGGYWDASNGDIVDTISEAREKWLTASPERAHA